jgi:polyferredoxin
MVLCNLIREAFQVNNNNNANNNNNNAQPSKSNNFLVLLLALLIQLLLNALVGQWLWNNSLVKLAPMLKKARWWDTLAVALLLMIVSPQ